jgi:site-specific DNA-methyltransferase (adenine-specific)
VNGMTLAERTVGAQELAIDPEFKAFIPWLRDEELEMLESSILKEGLREPLLVWNGIIVDGHNRYSVCQKHAIPVRVREMEFAGRDEALVWMIQNQLARRNLTPEQYSYLWGKRYKMEKKTSGGQEGNDNNPSGRAGKSQETEVDKLSTLDPGKTANKIASQAGVSERTVRRDEAFAKDIDTISQNTGMEQQEILSKKMPVTRQIVKEIAQMPPKAQQKAMKAVKGSKGIKSARDAVKAVKQEAKREEIIAAASSKGPVDTRQEIINSDFFEMNISPEKIDLYITSPPYNLEKDYGSAGDALSYEAYLEFTRRYLAKMYGGLKDDGWLCLNVPLDTNKGKHHAVYADVTAIATAVGFQYYSTIVWNEGNISSSTSFGSYANVQGACVIAPVEVIVVFCKKTSQKVHEGISTISESEFKQWVNGLWTFKGESGTKVGHPAPFPVELPDRCIKLFSYAGDVVLDPFLGSGTTLVACVQNHRKGVGVEINPEFCALAKARVAAAEREVKETLQV